MYCRMGALLQGALAGSISQPYSIAPPLPNTNATYRDACIIDPSLHVSHEMVVEALHEVAGHLVRVVAQPVDDQPYVEAQQRVGGVENLGV